MLTVYVPTGQQLCRERSVGPGFSERSTTPVSWFVTRTSALATTAPLGSCTVPVIAPVAPPWANPCTASPNSMALTTTNLIEVLDMLFFPMIFWKLDSDRMKAVNTRHSSLVARPGLAKSNAGPLSGAQIEISRHNRLDTALPDNAFVGIFRKLTESSWTFSSAIANPR